MTLNLSSGLYRGFSPAFYCVIPLINGSNICKTTPIWEKKTLAGSYEGPKELLIPQYAASVAVLGI